MNARAHHPGQREALRRVAGEHALGEETPVSSLSDRRCRPTPKTARNARAGRKNQRTRQPHREVKSSFTPPRVPHPHIHRFFQVSSFRVLRGQRASWLWRAANVVWARTSFLSASLLDLLRNTVRSALLPPSGRVGRPSARFTLERPRWLSSHSRNWTSAST
jgi:hypothetical protein